MPIQVIITGNDPTEVRQHLVGMLEGTWVLPTAEPPTQELNEVPKDLSNIGSGNGAPVEIEAEAAPKRKAGRPPKQPPAPREPAQSEAEAEAETQAEAADEPQDKSVSAGQKAVRDALNKYYVQVYGMDATQADILKLYAMRFTDGSVTKVSDIPEGMHATVVQDIKDMARTNHFKRTPVKEL